ncbi:30485_t:CDS:1, partial [Racocetra persica]
MGPEDSYMMQNKGYIKELFESYFSTTNTTSLPSLNTKTLEKLKKNHDDKMNIINDGTTRAISEMLVVKKNMIQMIIMNYN